MMKDYSSDILQNNYLEKLRTELVIDKKSYEELCYSLRCLAREWKGMKSIDKRIMQELYVLAPVTKNVAESVREYNGSLAHEIEALAIELDALVLECLAD